MPKKIFDIVPPKSHFKRGPIKAPESTIDTEDNEEEVLEIKKEPLGQVPVEKVPKKKRGFFYKIFIGLIVIIVLLAIPVIILSFRSKMILTIQLAQEEFSFQEEIEVSTAQEYPDFQARIIPGKIFETEKEKWEAFPASGKDFDGEKAKGVIKVYNAHTPPTPVALIKNTRFVSSQDGKTFIASEKIYIAAAQVKNGKTIPGSTEVEVQAQEEGEDYNIGPSSFSLPGLLGGALYYNVWGESTEPMKGGFKKEVKKVTEEDLEKAQEVLKQGLVELAVDSLKKEISQGFILAEETVFEKESQVSCFQEAGAKVEDFTCEGKIAAGGLGFKKADLERFAEQHFLKNVPEGSKLHQQSLTVDFSPKRIVAEEGKMTLSLDVKGKTYIEIDRENFLSQIRGKSQEEIKRIISKSYPQVERAEFKFWPFWIKKAPKALERIEVGWEF